jgi:hypothetical protein
MLENGDVSNESKHLQLRHLIPLVALAAIFLALAIKAVPGFPYQYDEADYMFAANLGLAANYTDTPTMPLSEFIRTGLKRGKDPQQTAQLSAQIRQSNDVLLYRHWHGPLYFYWLILTSHLDLGERQMRLATLVFPTCSLCLIYLGCLWIFPGAETIAPLAAILSSSLFAFMDIPVRSSELAPHQLFACCLLACVLLLTKMAATGNRLYLYGAVVAAALSWSLLEVAVVSVFTVLLCGFLDRKKLAADWQMVLWSGGLFFGTILLVWPPALLKLSFVKGFLGLAYLAVFRKSAWGQTTLLQIWQQHFSSAPLAWLILLIAPLFWFFASRRSGRLRFLYPIAIFAICMLAVTSRVNSASPRYLLVFQPALALLSGCILAERLSQWRPIAAYACTAALSLCLAAEAYADLQHHSVTDDPGLSPLLSFVRENHLETASMAVPSADLPTLHYYFPTMRLRGYSATPPDLSTFRPGAIDGVLYSGPPLHFEVLPAEPSP